jgi:hypothetical protein
MAHLRHEQRAVIAYRLTPSDLFATQIRKSIR